MTKKEAIEALITNMANQRKAIGDYEIPARYRKSMVTLIEFMADSFHYDIETGDWGWNFPTEEDLAANEG